MTFSQKGLCGLSQSPHVEKLKSHFEQRKFFGTSRSPRPQRWNFEWSKHKFFKNSILSPSIFDLWLKLWTLWFFFIFVNPEIPNWFIKYENNISAAITVLHVLIWNLCTLRVKFKSEFRLRPLQIVVMKTNIFSDRDNLMKKFSLAALIELECGYLLSILSIFLIKYRTWNCLKF